MASNDTFPVAAIGASAGGLEALERVFRNLPGDSGAAYIVITHLARNQVSNLPEILGRFTAMPVVSAADNARIEPNNVYVAPPGHVVVVHDGRVTLEERTTESAHNPIDVTFSSLALAKSEAAIGVLLSGGGTDGTLGMKAIKERGGLTMAQGADGSGPQQSGMPDSAIAAGVVDLVLPAEDIGGRLDAFAREQRHLFPGETGSHDAKAARHEICKLLLDRVGHDFSGYKERTFMRRVRRRMQVTATGSLEEYIARLSKDSDEIGNLFRDLLIGVTSFFRDPEAFEALEKTIIPKLFEGKGPGDKVRVWVPGCSTGEEAYSLAILLREYADALRDPPAVQVFATDIDDRALAVARLGRYPAPLLEHVSPRRLKRFFTGDGMTFAINKEIREICMFPAHSLLRDPPFSRIDMVSCRNLLIYLGNDFQHRVIPIFHFALRAGGYLFLGTSENISQRSDLFSPLDKKNRIFQRRDQIVPSVMIPMPSHGHSTVPLTRTNAGAMAATYRRAAEARVLEHFAPAHVVINRDGDVLHYSARTGKYLEPAPGQPNRQIVSMTRRGLRLDVREVLREAFDTNKPAHRNNVPVEVEDRIQLVDLTVEPFGESEGDPLFLLVFTDIGNPRQSEKDHVRAVTPGQDTAEQLEQELHETHERLQATVEEYEAAVEELKSSNEELQSINEELQSTNEEMETSKEELQSVNEELHTVNAELNNKVDELDRANSDLRNLFESTQIAIVFLDQNLMIRTFTPAVTSIFKLISSDRGRPLTDIVSTLDDEVELSRDIRSVFETGQLVQRRVRRQDHSATYLMRILPYRDRKSAVEGALVTFVDVSILVEAEDRQRTLVEELNHRVRNMLTVVGAIAKKTLAQYPKPEEFSAAFLSRIQSMARAYSLVSQQQWGDVSLHELLLLEINAYGSGVSKRVTLEGPEVSLKPPSTLSMGMVIHELVTNAIKYGALSAENGVVHIKWHRNAPKKQLVLLWQECDGPPVKPPKLIGFGTDLIDRELKGSLGGTARFEYPPDGAKVHMYIPMDDTKFTIDEGLDKKS